MNRIHLKEIKYLFIVLFVSLLAGCDDNTGSLGLNVMPDGDKPPVGTQTFNVFTRSILADSVYSRTNVAYLGKYTDPTFGVFEADFLAQFTSQDYEIFPETLQNDEATSTELYLYYEKYFGDSLNACHLRVDSLDRVLQEGDVANYYTSLNPANYYNENAAPLAQKAYTAVDLSASDSLRGTDDYVPFVRIKLPTSLGTYIIKKYKENKDFFKNSDAFIKNVFKGIYVRCDYGNGTILYIDQIILRVNYNYLVKRPSTGVVDSLVAGASRFSATKEVIQANHFENKGELEKLVQDPEQTYLKTPAGIFTEATLPIDDIYDKLKNDTLSSVALAFDCYINNGSSTSYKMGTPQNLLMVRKKDMYSFFENNQLADNITSFLVSYDSTNHQYNFTNIAQLVTTCINEKRSNATLDEDWNKVVLIPVAVTYDSKKTSIVSIRHDLEINSARLRGGSIPGKELKMNIIYSTLSGK